jgi:hypothetical protein
MEQSDWSDAILFKVSSIYGDKICQKMIELLEYGKWQEFNMMVDVMFSPMEEAA